MLISFSHRFIFLHVQRTAGGSTILALRRYEHRAPATNWNKLLSRTGFRRDPQKISFRTHETAVNVRRLLPKSMYDDFFSIAFVRNPWSWLVSLYEVIRQDPEHRHYGILTKMNDFREYVDWEVGRGKRYQYRLVADHEGQVMVNFLGRFERLREDYQRICEHLDIPPLDALPHTHKRTPADYREYYDGETREKVATHWQKDIALFGYTFDGLIEDARHGPCMQWRE